MRDDKNTDIVSKGTISVKAGNIARRAAVSAAAVLIIMLAILASPAVSREVNAYITVTDSNGNVMNEYANQWSDEQYTLSVGGLTGNYITHFYNIGGKSVFCMDHSIQAKASGWYKGSEVPELHRSSLITNSQPWAKQAIKILYYGYYAKGDQLWNKNLPKEGGRRREIVSLALSANKNQSSYPACTRDLKNYVDKMPMPPMAGGGTGSTFEKSELWTVWLPDKQLFKSQRVKALSNDTITLPQGVKMECSDGTMYDGGRSVPVVAGNYYTFYGQLLMLNSIDIKIDGGVKDAWWYKVFYPRKDGSGTYRISNNQVGKEKEGARQSMAALELTDGHEKLTFKHKKTHIKIRKIDYNTREPLAGAHFKVTADYTQNVYCDVTGADGWARFDGTHPEYGAKYGEKLEIWATEEDQTFVIEETKSPDPVKYPDLWSGKCRVHFNVDTGEFTITFYDSSNNEIRLTTYAAEYMSPEEIRDRLDSYPNATAGFEYANEFERKLAEISRSPRGRTVNIDGDDYVVMFNPYQTAYDWTADARMDKPYVTVIRKNPIKTDYSFVDESEETVMKSALFSGLQSYIDDKPFLNKYAQEQQTKEWVRVIANHKYIRKVYLLEDNSYIYDQGLYPWAFPIGDYESVQDGYTNPSNPKIPSVPKYINQHIDNDIGETKDNYVYGNAKVFLPTYYDITYCNGNQYKTELGEEFKLAKEADDRYWAALSAHISVFPYLFKDVDGEPCVNVREFAPYLVDQTPGYGHGVERTGLGTPTRQPMFGLNIEGTILSYKGFKTKTRIFDPIYDVPYNLGEYYPSGEVAKDSHYAGTCKYIAEVDYPQKRKEGRVGAIVKNGVIEKASGWGKVNPVINIAVPKLADIDPGVLIVPNGTKRKERSWSFKKVGENGQPLAGVKFKFTTRALSSDGKPPETVVLQTDEDGICYVPDSALRDDVDYTMEEVEPPSDEYIKLDDKWTVRESPKSDIDAENTVFIKNDTKGEKGKTYIMQGRSIPLITIENFKKGPPVKFIKVDAETGEELGGAIYSVSYKNPEKDILRRGKYELGRWFNEEVQERKLLKTKYTLQEYSAPEGWYNSDEKYEFTVGDPNDTSTWKVIAKSTGEEIAPEPGITYGLVYKIPDRRKPTSWRFRKVNQNGEPLAGVKFKFESRGWLRYDGSYGYNGHPDVKYVTTDSDGIATVPEGLLRKDKDYTLSEYEAPAHVRMTNETWRVREKSKTVEVESDWDSKLREYDLGSTVPLFTVKNWETPPEGRVIFYKMDNWQGPVDGAEFELYSEAGYKQRKQELQDLGYSVVKPLGTYTSDGKGKVVIEYFDDGTRIDEGSYYLIESKVPPGYRKMKDKRLLVRRVYDDRFEYDFYELDGTKVKQDSDDKKLIDDRSIGLGFYKSDIKDDKKALPYTNIEVRVYNPATDSIETFNGNTDGDGTLWIEDIPCYLNFGKDGCLYEIKEAAASPGYSGNEGIKFYLAVTGITQDRDKPMKYTMYDPLQSDIETHNVKEMRQNMGRENTKDITVETNIKVFGCEPGYDVQEQLNEHKSRYAIKQELPVIHITNKGSTGISFEKIDFGSGYKLDGAVFTLTGDDVYGKHYHMVKASESIENGRVRFLGLREGEYIVEETKTSDDNHKGIDYKFRVVVDKNLDVKCWKVHPPDPDKLLDPGDYDTIGGCDVYQVPNYAEFKLRVRKYGYNWGGYLKGVTFRLTGDNILGEHFDKTYITDDKGEIHIKGIGYGKYRLKEESTIHGYVISNEDDEWQIDIETPVFDEHEGRWKGQVKVYNEAGSLFYKEDIIDKYNDMRFIEIENKPIIIGNSKSNLPSAGGGGIKDYIFSGMILLLTACIVFIIANVGKNRESEISEE